MVKTIEMRIKFTHFGEEGAGTRTLFSYFSSTREKESARKLSVSVVWNQLFCSKDQTALTVDQLTLLSEANGKRSVFCGVTRAVIGASTFISCKKTRSEPLHKTVNRK